VYEENQKEQTGNWCKNIIPKRHQTKKKKKKERKTTKAKI
jgi:hypothetical protein